MSTRRAQGTEGTDRRPRAPAVIAAIALIVVCGAPLAGAATNDPLREGVRNGTTSSETEIVGRLGASGALKGGYVTRQSNLSLTGGGAIYGCRASFAPTSEACVRANNLSTGRAFEFESRNGALGGTITVGGGGDGVKPFTTNATGVATGLNADRLDSLDASQIVTAARTKSGLDADKVDGLDSTDFLPASTLIPYRSKLSIGEERVLATRGTVSLVHQCVDLGAGSFRSRVIARTTAADAAMDGSDDHTGPGGSGDFLQPATADDDSELQGIASTMARMSSEIDQGFVASADLAHYLAIDTETAAFAVHVGGVDCAAIGQVMVV